MNYARTNFAPGVTNIAPIATNDIVVPRKTISSESSAWNQFAASGFTTNVEAYGLKTVLHVMEIQVGSYSTGTAFGRDGSVQYLLTHTATDAAKNYYYRVEGLGGRRSAVTGDILSPTPAEFTAAQFFTRWISASIRLGVRPLWTSRNWIKSRNPHLIWAKEPRI